MIVCAFAIDEIFRLLGRVEMTLEEFGTILRTFQRVVGVASRRRFVA